MRHILLPAPPALAPRRVIHATTKARLVAPAGSALRLASGLPRTVAGTVNLPRSHQLQISTCVRQRAHRNSRPGVSSARATAMDGRWPQRVEYCPGMRARHGVGHGVESQTWPFRSAPCLPIQQVRHRAIVRSATAAALRPRAQHEKACGYVDNARALPTSPQATAKTAKPCLIAYPPGRRSDPSPFAAVRRRAASIPPGNYTEYAQMLAAVHMRRRSAESWGIV